MESFPLFFRIRAITFTSIMLFSSLWLVLLCVEIFTRWSVSDKTSQSLMILFILANTITLVMLPMLILVQFRIWLDAARLLLLSLLQVGSAIVCSIWSPGVQCPDQTSGDLSACQLIIIYTMIACWIIPAILVFYSTYFAVVVYLQSRIPVVVQPTPYKSRSGFDLETGFTGSYPSWKQKLKEIVAVHGSNAGSLPRPPPLPPMIQSSLPHPSAFQHRSTMLHAPCRQSTMPPIPRDGQRFSRPLPPVPSRHHSLPVFNPAHRPHFRTMLTLSTPHPLATNTNASSSHLPTPTSQSHSIPSPATPQHPTFKIQPGVADVQSDRRMPSRHLSMMPWSLSPRETQNAEENLATQPARTRLSKSPPIHLM